MYNAVVFDLDGTLTDSKEGIWNSVRYALNKMNRPVPPDDVLQRFLGPPLAESFMNYCGMNRQEAEKGTAFYREAYQPDGWKQNAVYPGIRPLLHALKKAGVYLAVATGKPEKNALEVLDYFDLLPFFDCVAGPDYTDLHADKAALICRALPENLRKNALMVGDVFTDIQGAHVSGIHGAAAFWGYGDPQEILKENPEKIYDTPDEMLYDLFPEATGNRGLFITFEGVDGCGKTTQQKLLEKKLTKWGYSCTLTREPGGTPIAENIRNIVLAKEDGGMCAETEALLFAAARAQHIHEVIAPALHKGKMVLCDRYVDSSLVYQGFSRNLDLSWVRELNRPAFETGLPDMTFYLRIAHEEALSRRNAQSEPDRIEKAGDRFFAMAEAAYERLCREEPKRIIPVNASGCAEDISEEIWAKVHQKLLEESL